MWLLDKLLKSVITRGRMVVTDHDGTIYRYGTGDGSEAPLHVRLTNRKTANHIARHPQVGAGEAFMWGWLTIEPPHDIRDLVLFFSMQRQGARRQGDPGPRSWSASSPRKRSRRLTASTRAARRAGTRNTPTI